MRVASGVAAGGLVINRSHDVDRLHAIRRLGISNPRVLSGTVAYGVLVVAARTDLAVQAGERRMLAGIGREHHPPFAVVHPDAVDSLLIRDDLHDLVSGLAIIVEHGVPGCAGNASGKLISTQDHGLDQLLLFGAKIDVAADPANGDDQDGERKDQLRAESSRHSRGSQRLPGIEVFGPNCIGPYLIKAIWGKARAP